MAIFPLSFIPKLPYSTGGRRFGDQRGSMLHPGCDLIAPQGTPILAVESGIVVAGPYSFYRGTFAIEVQHPLFIVRYCEIERVAPGVARGARVKEGQTIAFVGKMFVDSMLHLEMYKGTEKGPLTRKDILPYKRRKDLIDLTPYLNQWAIQLRAKQNKSGQSPALGDWESGGNSFAA